MEFYDPIVNLRGYLDVKKKMEFYDPLNRRGILAFIYPPPFLPSMVGPLSVIDVFLFCKKKISKKVHSNKILAIQQP